MTVKEMKQTTIYTIIPIYGNTTTYKVVSDTLYNHILSSQELTTSPRGIEPICFVEEIEEELQNEGSIYERIVTHAIKAWSKNGTLSIVDKFESQEEAQNELFNRIYEYDFLKDDQRITDYWHTIEEAQNECDSINNNEL